MRFLILLSFLLIGASYGDNRDRVIVIDTGVSHSDSFDKYLCDGGTEDTVGTDGDDTNGHGSNVTSIIASYLDPKTQCIHSIKWYDRSDTPEDLKIMRLNAAYMRALHVPNAKVLNLSMSGNDREGNEEHMLNLLLDKGIHIVVAAGNEGQDLSKNCNAFPACYPMSNNFLVVGNARQGIRWPSSNFGGPVNTWADGVEADGGGFVYTGTSQATARASGMLMKGLRNVTP